MIHSGKFLLAVVLCLALGGGAFGQPGRPARPDFVVAPDGRDDNPGTAARPFATLERSREAVRGLRQTAPEKDILVMIRGGVYRLAQTVVFGLEDSAAEGRTITYAAWPGEQPVFCSDEPIRDWKKIEASPAGLPEKARGKVWAAELQRGRAMFYSLYDGGKRLPRARGAGFSPLSRKAEAEEMMERLTLAFPKGALRKWPNLGQIELAARTVYPWAYNYLPLSVVDEARGIATVAYPATYALNQTVTQPKAEPTMWVENVVDALDEPGEWVWDRAEGRLYLWPPGGEPGEDVAAPRLSEFIRVEGKINYDGPADTPVRGLVFRGLTFAHGDRWPWEKGHVGWGIQHDWEMFDRPTAMVRLRGAERCRIEECHFTQSAGAAVRLDLHARDNVIRDNLIEHIGGVGVLLAGYGPGTKDVNQRNTVVNNHLRHIGEIARQSSAIFAWQSGHNRIAHNLIHDVPYDALVVSGRIVWDRKGQGECSRTIRWREIDRLLAPSAKTPDWRQREPFLHARKNVVEFNEAFRTMQHLGDGNPFYVSGAGGENLLRMNYTHDNYGHGINGLIRCDDDQHLVTMEANVLCDSESLAGIIAKGDCDIINNVMIGIRPAPRHRGFICYSLGPVTGSRVERNVVVSAAAGEIPVDVRRVYGDGPIPKLADIRADNNIYYNTADPRWAQTYLAQAREVGLEAHSVAEDPLFGNPKGGDFTFQAGSPAARLGIKPIDVRRMGLEKPLPAWGELKM